MSILNQKVLDLSKSGITFYESSYLNLCLSAKGTESTEEQVFLVALVAGSHQEQFPYVDSVPWDNVLLLINGEHYRITHYEEEAQGKYLQMPNPIDTSGSIMYHGLMVRDSDDKLVEVELRLNVSLITFEPFYEGKLGKRPGFEKFPGLKWQPAELYDGEGLIKVQEADRFKEYKVSNVHGELESGKLRNIPVETFAIAYDYLCVSMAPLGDFFGYSYVNFVSHALYPTGFGLLLDKYLVKFASESLTLAEGKLYGDDFHEGDGNKYGVIIEESDLGLRVIFEAVVDLGSLANVHRQMVRTQDHAENILYGLREIFVPKKALE